MIVVKPISTTIEFAAIRDEWNDLLQASDSDTIFLTWEWAFSWWEIFHEANMDLFILIVRERCSQLRQFLSLGGFI